jgi:hypothetical protein
MHCLSFQVFKVVIVQIVVTFVMILCMCVSLCVKDVAQVTVQQSSTA